MRKPQQQEQQQFVDKQLLILDQVLREECAYVDREALGHWCGLSVPWWEPGHNLSLDDFLRLLRQLHDNEVPNIAVRLARRRSLEDMGVLGYALLASPTLQQGLQLSAHLVESNFPFLKVSLATDNEHALVSCDVMAGGSDYFQLLLEEWIFSLWVYIQALLPEGLAACASYATLNYHAPTYHWQYQQILGCRVDFDQPRAVLAIPKQWLYIAVKGRSGHTQQLYDTQVKRLLKEQEHSGDIVSRVKRLLLEKPVQCDYRLETTAPFLSLSARTLRRYLAEAGTSFRAVSLEVRMDLAKDYLLNTQLTAQEIAYQLGYAQPNNFYRAFKSFYQLPPEQYRLLHS
ncbi:helix-turn-helix domain-containing protein [Pseudomaricurvus sp.]|uniref:AraC family transcriptional regulator n=1 Tax=Pseudomaricurvus sp. TaxID=2004510 RepID=UPI003F6BAE14